MPFIATEIQRNKWLSVLLAIDKRPKQEWRKLPDQGELCTSSTYAKSFALSEPISCIYLISSRLVLLWFATLVVPPPKIWCHCWFTDGNTPSPLLRNTRQRSRPFLHEGCPCFLCLWNRSWDPCNEDLLLRRRGRTTTLLGWMRCRMKMVQKKEQWSEWQRRSGTNEMLTAGESWFVDTSMGWIEWCFCFFCRIVESIHEIVVLLFTDILFRNKLILVEIRNMILRKHDNIADEKMVGYKTKNGFRTKPKLFDFRKRAFGRPQNGRLQRPSRVSQRMLDVYYVVTVIVSMSSCFA